ncbi:hypothetical protein BDY17DRAFT_300238 [Neohortaea acidophila]|uniref:Uncharacterized protein n=1 Tax=Neohortaea acidophila TaxID=245834 RepID=A0A6A6PPP5_9PEZI|nr:uncharacterized protein BDY17DRAFT_300238 [Neohortaea acidophila]KAF2482080.1 hypothetical protein BDY17DRAFT_300238 [Neohortaea acidophila]
MCEVMTRSPSRQDRTCRFQSTTIHSTRRSRINARSWTTRTLSQSIRLHRRACYVRRRLQHPVVRSMVSTRDRQGFTMTISLNQHFFPRQRREGLCSPPLPAIPSSTLTTLSQALHMGATILPTCPTMCLPTCCRRASIRLLPFPTTLDLSHRCLSAFVLR